MIDLNTRCSSTTQTPSVLVATYCAATLQRSDIPVYIPTNGNAN